MHRKCMESCARTKAIYKRCMCATTNADNLKKVMRCIPQPVVIVTASSINLTYGSVKRGVTCSSFVSTALEPPTVSVSVYNGNIINDLIKTSQRFTANVLTDQQVCLGMHFAKPLNSDLSYNQFENIDYSNGQAGIPLLKNSLGVMQCKVSGVTEVGDHKVWYGEIIEATAINENSNAQPLLYYQRTFRTIGDEIFMTAFETTTIPFVEWTHEAHLRMAWNYITAHGQEKATPKIKLGILKFNEKNKHLITHGYNETVTCFYINVISKCIQSMPDGHTFEEFLSCKQHLKDTEYLWRFYSPTVIQSELAKSIFLEPDKNALP